MASTARKNCGVTSKNGSSGNTMIRLRARSSISASDRPTSVCANSGYLIVELTVPDGWPIHITWAAMALGIMAWGPGALSADYLIRHFLNLPTPRR